MLPARFSAGGIFTSKDAPKFKRKRKITAQIQPNPAAAGENCVMATVMV
ncbi:hypothetical protein FHX08_002253 [Rhizobium sp. BK529]|nr:MULTISPECIES: hypothetical protein [unclassified Rhizobium]MBB3591909.1 hypothetical protein [Rhizobium sp. BK529]